MITSGTKKVAEFQKAFGLTNNINPTFLTPQERRLRYDLFKEEFDEFLEGFESRSSGLEFFISKKGIKENSFVYMVDAVCDMYYILFGTNVSHGWHMFALDNNEILNSYDGSISDMNLIRDMQYYCFEYKDLINNNRTVMCGYNAVKTKLKVLKKISVNLGIDDIIEELFSEVHNSNMSKLDEFGKPIVNGEDGVLDHSKPIGKVLKSKNFFEPNLYDILKKTS